ncbi:hypothetical protein V5O48_010858 [Marasmius crinis-equi]|uniref:Carrier domain-containing protein n=1 Tax=Marasmius crinis-equi TaxID=585013 RepID=A0ABR3F775_9AGAR
MSAPLSFLGHRPPLLSTSECLGDTLAEKLASEKTQIRSLLDCLPHTSDPAICSSDPSRPALTHHDLHKFISSFALPRNLSRNDRVAILLPNGPENAVALLCVSAYHTCAPLNASCTPSELREDVLRLNVKAILTTRDLAARLDLRGLVEELRCYVSYVDARRTGPAGLFDLQSERGKSELQLRPRTPNEMDDRVLVLCTSGTSGKKKVVPYSLRCLVVGSWAVVQSWGLTSSDVNLNMMPLFHVGGVVRNLLSPVLSGGSTIVCTGFDAVAFWSIASEMRATWYYAAPTIHNAILASQPKNITPSRDLSIRMICNAAGGLLPSLALELKSRFDGAVVLPSYGMTECMPIASPPTTYQLDRPGCSGIACGPHISIRDPLNLERELRTGEHGAVSVRGFPMFSGYEVAPNPQVPLDTSSFSKEGWFDTGDMGYLDKDGYLFITGRSKEIINKGGEVISPFEIEEAVSIAARGRIKATLAFSVEHDALQETIGLVVVPAAGQLRIGLQQLHTIVKDSLHPSKWPFLVVYMNDIPKNSAGKPQRINLAKRLGLPCFSDSIPLLARHYEARVARVQVNISDAIRCNPVSVDFSSIHGRISEIPGIREAAVRPGSDGIPEAFVSLEGDAPVDSTSITASLSSSLPGYALPEIHIFYRAFPKSPEGEVDFELLEKYNLEQTNSTMSSDAMLVRDIVADLLILEPSKIVLESDFFLLGGSSLLLGKLSYQLRKATGVDVGITALFTNSTIAGITSLIEAERRAASLDARSETVYPSPSPSDFGDRTPRKSPNSPVLEYFSGSTFRPNNRTRHQNHPFVLLIQALSFVLFYPLKSALTWTIFIFMLSSLAPHIGHTFWERMGALMCSLMVSRMLTRIVAPIVAIGLKWAIIGRYEPGLYPMWSNYHLRWWIVNQALMTAGHGIFSSTQGLEIIYYRLLGAKIGRGVSIDKKAQLGEFDLLTVHDGCTIDQACVRGFCVEKDGYFRLAPIVIGPNSTINTMTQITPGSTIPEDSVYGPQSSSLEGASPSEFKAYNRKAIPRPHPVLRYSIAVPIIVLVEFVSLLPWFIMLWLMFNSTFRVQKSRGAFVSVVVWFANPTRVGYHVLAKAAKAVVVPLLRMFLGIMIKRILGLNNECRGSPSQLFLLRQYVSSKLLSQKHLRDAFNVLGSHYEVVSVGINVTLLAEDKIIYRAMGAKIGRRVYWPGSGIYCLDPELLEIGDDVVFGSRSELFTTDGRGSEKIVIGNGAMIADRVILLPGTTVGSRTVMGSGTLSVRNGNYPDGSMWIGNKNGKPVCLKTGTPTSEKVDSTTPFGRAFYEGKAPYYVYPYPLLLLINVVVGCTTAAYWTMAGVIAAQVLRALYLAAPHLPIFEPHWYQFAAIYGIIAVIYVLVVNLQALIALTWVTIMKWILIGRRRVGEYDWDKNSYCQRWKLHLVLSNLIVKGFGGAGLLRAISGSAYLVWYYRAHGANIGKDCSIFASGALGLMTEPDLVELGDHVALDNCSVVAHINSRGNFSLNYLKIGDGCALRSGSRLLSGASMEEQAVLGEHTLLTSGEVAASGALYVGWPGRRSQKS